MTPIRTFTTPLRDDLGLRRIANAAGLSASVLPNACLFAFEHTHGTGRTLISQIEGSPLDGGIGRLFLRVGPAHTPVEIVGPSARADFAALDDRFVWEGEAPGIRHHTTLWLHPERALWLWQVEVANVGDAPLTCDATLVQDVGLGSRGFVMGNEAYASQYIDHHVADHPTAGAVVMSRQNLAQAGAFPWLAQGCADGAAAFATDALQLLGPAFRDDAHLPAGDLPASRLQHEVACPIVRSRPATLAPGATSTWRFFALYVPDHPAASGDSDLAAITDAIAALAAFTPCAATTATPPRSLLQDAPPIAGAPLPADRIDALYPSRFAEERDGDGRLLSFFVPDGALNRHVVLREKERTLPRRHGAIVRTGRGMLLDETTMCATTWMHGVFGALLSIGNTSFHRLLSPSRDPYNITRSGGLRLLVDTGTGWRLLGEPSLFEIGLSDCRWIYVLDDRTVTVRLAASGDDPALQWRVAVGGAPCRFLVSAGLVLGERELDHAGRVEIDADRRRIAFRPDPGWLWGQRYPDAVYHLVTATPDAVEAIGGDELLHADGVHRGGGFVALRTRPTTALDFAVVGTLADPAEADRLATAYAADGDQTQGLAAAADYWRHVTRATRLHGGLEVAAIDAFLPWLAQNAMIHLTVPHGLEQSGGAAWGTRDVCQGPVEFLLAYEHDAVVRDILVRVFAQQFADAGDWPQWFMVEPYAQIRDRHSHGDVIVWPLKALCDYIEATEDFAILDEPAPWRRDDDLSTTDETAPIAEHVAKLLATVRARFVPGTHLIRYGEGDWNDSLQPADPSMRDWMVSSWTVALLIQQLARHAEVLDRAGRPGGADLTALARAMRADFDRHLVRDGIVAGYAIFHPDGGTPELLLHPADTRTGLSYSLLPMTRSIIAGIFTGARAETHHALIREHLLFPDGARLMDRPVAYRGGTERTFRRAESAAFFGREIGLMYVHAHLRYGEAMASLSDATALWQALAQANPVAVASTVASASPRQRNAYFSSSDLAYPDRTAASAEWQRARDGTIPADGGWRIYSSGPGLYANLLFRHALGFRRRYGERVAAPLLPPGFGPVSVEREIDGRHERRDLSGPARRT